MVILGLKKIQEALQGHARRPCGQKNSLEKEDIQLQALPLPYSRPGDFDFNKLTFASNSKKPKQPHLSETFLQWLLFSAGHWGDQRKNNFSCGLDELGVK